MPNDKFVLFCAGEDSGDSIGEPLVKAIAARFLVKGSGGTRMQNAGLEPLVHYETLPVSGFGDVLPKYFKLRKSFSELKSALESPNCVGLVAIDYPGFNMKLVKRAGELHKPALYVAPPQVWAWKKKRAAELAKNLFAKLAVFFDFEEAVYHEAGCNVVRVRHPFVDVRNENGRSDAAIQVLLLPGSRKAQALRNLPLYLNAVRNDENVVLVAARQDLVSAFERTLRRIGGDSLLRRVLIKVAPSSAEERMAFYRSAENVITAPGTATLELALSGTPFTVCTKPDLLTYCLGRLFIKTKFFALPNIILDRLVFSEHIVPPWSGLKTGSMANGTKENVAKELSEKLAVGSSFDQLVLEFLGQLVESKTE